MAVALRLSRIGKKHVPFYRIIAIDSRKKRDSASLAYLGTYDALNSRLVTFHADRFKAWAAQGAKMSDAVKRLYVQYRQAQSADKVSAGKKRAANKASAAKEEA